MSKHDFVRLTPEERRTRITSECLCTVVQTTTDNKTVAHLERHEECPWHPFWYLGIPMRIVEDHGDGWADFRHPDGKIWKHWKDQTGIDMNFGNAQTLLPHVAPK